MSKKFIQNIGILLAAIVSIFLAYLFFSGDDTDTSVLVSQLSEEQEKLLQELSQLERELKSISLDTSVLESEAFTSLKDFSVPLEPQPRGRRNPFAPLGN